MNKKILNWSIFIIILIAILFGVSFFSLCIGSTVIPIKKTIALFFDKNESIEHTILFDIRLPRILLGFAIGGALSIAGVILQSLFRNPLVEPYTLGISGGATLGICINIIFKLHKILGNLSFPLFGFLGAIFIVFLVYSLTLKKGKLKIYELLLIGVMISFISSSFIMLIMAISQIEDLQGIIFWIMGSLEESNWTLIKITVANSILCLCASYFYCISLNAISLGEEEAIHLGINVEKIKKSLYILTSLLVGVSVSVAGIIGFVGLIIPHIMRIFVGEDHRILLISSFLSGAVFLILCDTLARTIIAPLELPVGVITGILGGTVFVYLLNKKK